MWTNLVNGKKYIGSSVDLRIRFLQYFNINQLVLIRLYTYRLNSRFKYQPTSNLWLFCS
jgi:hypothetical protein